MLTLFKRHNQDSISNLLPIFYPQLIRLNENLILWPDTKQAELANYLKSYKIDFHDEILLMAFSNYLNNEAIGIENISNTVEHNSKLLRENMVTESKLFEQNN